jgi:hypothetical protein
MALVMVIILPSVNAQDCGELVLQVRDLEASSFDEYHQLNDMKQDTLLILYSRERATCPPEVSTISLFTIEFINDFEHVYNLGKKGDHESREAALDAALQLSDDIKAYQNTDLSAESKGVLDSASRALREFLLVQAKVYVTNAEKAPATGVKIYNYKKATQAYSGAGETIEVENLKLKWQAMETTYLRDLDIAGELVARGDNKYAMAKPKLSGNIFSKIDAYILSRSASLDYAEALVYYNYHLEAEKIDMTSEKISEVGKTMVDLRRAITKFFVLSTITLVGLSLYILNRLKSWSGDTYDYSLGNELVVSSSAE